MCAAYERDACAVTQQGGRQDGRRPVYKLVHAGRNKTQDALQISRVQIRRRRSCLRHCTRPWYAPGGCRC